MATVDRPRTDPKQEDSLFDEDGLPWLENGETMDQKTFHARYEKTPPGFKAELIGGIVYVMACPVGNSHSERDSESNAWLVVYRASTPGVMVRGNVTLIIGHESEPQPDSALLILPQFGGQTRTGGPGNRYTVGAPELVVEVANSTRSIDLRKKLDDYQRAGVCEYLVLDLQRKTVHWWRLVDGRYVPIETGDEGWLRSHVFSGLWLDPVAMVNSDIARVLAVLNLGLASLEHAVFVADLRRRHDQLSGQPVRE